MAPYPAYTLVPYFCRVAAVLDPDWGPCGLRLIYSPLSLKLPVLRPQNR